MAGFALKLKTKSGQHVVKGLTPTSTIKELKMKLASLTNIKEPNLHVLSGYPPKPVDLSECDALLEDSGIVSGDTLIVEEKISVEVVNETARPHVAEQPTNHGILMRKVVPADNSCLFTSIGFVLGGKVDTTCGSFMREIIAEVVANDSDNYSEAILGKPSRAYCDWILRPDSWGGAIELAVLSRFYGLEIAVVDTLNAIINRFGEDQDFPQRVFLVFDGIHYDPLYMEQAEGTSIQTIFPSTDERILHEAQMLAREAKESRQFTDVHRFSLRCLECRVLLTGQKEAHNHARDTGHVKFGEVLNE